mmetsp:Transcript_30706/g.73607  ORF Transcript_30706/g.73607 Transcript_30706/m.73607 type:complete len:216 (-) Transcript_30706:3-650(-)
MQPIEGRAGLVLSWTQRCHRLDLFFGCPAAVLADDGSRPKIALRSRISRSSPTVIHRARALVPGGLHTRSVATLGQAEAHGGLRLGQLGVVGPGARASPAQQSLVVPLGDEHLAPRVVILIGHRYRRRGELFGARLQAQASLQIVAARARLGVLQSIVQRRIAWCCIQHWGVAVLSEHGTFGIRKRTPFLRLADRRRGVASPERHSTGPPTRPAD